LLPVTFNIALKAQLEALERHLVRVRHAYAHGLLQGYALVEADEPRAAA